MNTHTEHKRDDTWHSGDAQTQRATRTARRGAGVLCLPVPQPSRDRLKTPISSLPSNSPRDIGTVYTRNPGRRQCAVRLATTAHCSRQLPNVQHVLTLQPTRQRKAPPQCARARSLAGQHCCLPPPRGETYAPSTAAVADRPGAASGVDCTLQQRTGIVVCEDRWGEKGLDGCATSAPSIVPHISPTVDQTRLTPGPHRSKANLSSAAPPSLGRHRRPRYDRRLI
mmetsp:Transcript_5660/g.18804  ORF Transcript_5660/g.18804 Transcript_5660/m.18804 type:complete len:225 (-) Transcript_5660:407-1081(-)|eukprot:scaffold2619_cov123-Isochrysis_galbana.AAC.10